ncbi:MAG TPA: hypothetical protein VF456_00455 [Vicinamibacterales bacterium]
MTANLMPLSDPQIDNITAAPAHSRPESTEEHAPGWNAATRVLFRFCFVYFGVYVLTTQMLAAMMPWPSWRFPPLETLPPILPVLMWSATHVFGIAATPVVISGSGDKYLNWIAVLSLLAISLVAATLWSVLDRRRPARADVALFEWFRVFVRFALGATMITYGFQKVMPLQMSFPQLSRLVEPFGNFSPMGVLWNSIGASPAYERFVGSAEVLGGVLLFVPRLTLLGSLVCLIDASEVFALNMTYDVPVKLLSFHLLLMALFLAAPDAPRLLNVLVRNRPALPRADPPLAHRRARQRLLVGAQIVFGLWLVGFHLLGASRSWRRSVGAPTPPLYGIWNVEDMTIDGQSRPSLVTDQAGWRRIIVQSPNAVRFQRMDDGFVDYGAKIDDGVRLLTLTKPVDPAWRATFSIEQQSPILLTLDGTMDGHPTRFSLRRIDPNQFLLVTQGFHWVQERPFNR